MRHSRRFCFRLAAQLGMTVRELLQRLGSDELVEWMAFDQLEPMGRTAHQLAMLARFKLKPDADITLEDLIPYYMQPPPEPIRLPSPPERRALSSRMADFFRRKAGL